MAGGCGYSATTHEVPNFSTSITLKRNELRTRFFYIYCASRFLTNAVFNFFAGSLNSEFLVCPNKYNGYHPILIINIKYFIGSDITRLLAMLPQN